MSNHLYRIFDNGSFVKFDKQTGFAAGSQTAFDSSAADANIFVERHADWGNRMPTPFISTTSSLNNAAYLAGKPLRSNVRAAIIDRAVVERHSRVYYLLELVNSTGAQIAQIARNDNERICEWYVPGYRHQRAY
jgi:hypothetical protein